MSIGGFGPNNITLFIGTAKGYNTPEACLEN